MKGDKPATLLNKLVYVKLGRSILTYADGEVRNERQLRALLGGGRWIFAGRKTFIPRFIRSRHLCDVKGNLSTAAVGAAIEYLRCCSARVKRAQTDPSAPPAFVWDSLYVAWLDQLWPASHFIYVRMRK